VPAMRRGAAVAASVASVAVASVALAAQHGALWKSVMAKSYPLAVRLAALMLQVIATRF
jgi:hypothetical protein